MGEISFTQEQLNAVHFKDGPCLCLAGPGSGKTAVLVERVGCLIREGKADPSRILVITFTRDAAEEMQKRYLKRPDASKKVTFGTFHSVFYRILRSVFHFKSEDLLTGVRQKRFVELTARHMGIVNNSDENFYIRLTNAISSVRNGRIPQDGLPGDMDFETIKTLINTYQEEKHKAHVIDFDDMLYLTRHILNNREDSRSYWQRRFSYILVDESQDLNKIQYDVVKILAAPENNLFMVGDDDQSIYGFRGADPSFLLGFNKDYPDAETIILNKNFRCKKDIVESSKMLIAHNKKRFEKDIIPAQDEASTGIIRYLEAMDPKAEAVMIVSLISELMSEGISAEEIAVLYRNRRESYMLSSVLAASGISVSSSAESEIISGQICSDLLAYLKLAVECAHSADKDTVSRSLLLQVINRPDRGLSRLGMNDERIRLSEWLKYLSGSESYSKASMMVQSVRTIASLSPVTAVRFIRKATGYDDFLRSRALADGTDYEELYAQEDVIQEIAAGSRTLADFIKYIEDRRRLQKEMSEASSKRGDKKDRKGKIGFYTFHGSKGLEFDSVIILHANQGITPDRHAAGTDEMEEERRMFYVAMTRARRNLIFTVIAKRGSEVMYPSQFLREAAVSLNLVKSGGS